MSRKSSLPDWWKWSQGAIAVARFAGSLSLLNVEVTSSENMHLSNIKMNLHYKSFVQITHCVLCDNAVWTQLSKQACVSVFSVNAPVQCAAQGVGEAVQFSAGAALPRPSALQHRLCCSAVSSTQQRKTNQLIRPQPRRRPPTDLLSKLLRSSWELRQQHNVLAEKIESRHTPIPGTPR